MNTSSQKPRTMPRPILIGALVVGVACAGALLLFKRATVARSGLPRSADFLPAPQNEEARQAGSPLPSGSPEIAGSGIKSALRLEISSQSAAQASSLYRKSAQRDCEGSIK